MTLTVLELDNRLKTGEHLRLVDVREPEEWAICHLPNATHIPLGELERRAGEELQADEPMVVYCHHGVRSARARQWLLAHGFQTVYNLAGGIEDWSRYVDPTVQRY